MAGLLIDLVRVLATAQPLVLLAAGVLLWASTWFENHVAPREYLPSYAL